MTALTSSSNQFVGHLSLVLLRSVSEFLVMFLESVEETHIVVVFWCDGVKLFVCL